MNSVREKLFTGRWVGYIGSVFGSAAVTAFLSPFRDHINSTTVALAFLLVVIFVAILWGSRPALLASVLGVVCFNFFFIPPVYTFTIADPQNWVALAVFFITALTVGQLSARARLPPGPGAEARILLFFESRDYFGCGIRVWI